MRGWKHFDFDVIPRIDGNTPHEDRDKQIQEYNAEGSEKFIFMLSTRWLLYIARFSSKRSILIG